MTGIMEVYISLKVVVPVEIISFVAKEDPSKIV
jgi:hypothetical protein